MVKTIVDGKIIDSNVVDLENHLKEYYDKRKLFDERIENVIKNEWDAIKELLTPEAISDLSKVLRAQLAEYHEEFNI